MAPPTRKDDSPGIDDLCGGAEERARRLGHRLGAWRDEGEGQAVVRRTTCTICGAVAYVRLEGSLAGAAGRACTESCPGSGSPGRDASRAGSALPDAEIPSRA